MPRGNLLYIDKVLTDYGDGLVEGSLCNFLIDIVCCDNLGNHRTGGLNGLFFLASCKKCERNEHQNNFNPICFHNCTLFLLVC